MSKHYDVSRGTLRERYDTLREFCDVSGYRKSFIATQLLGVSPCQLSYLLKADIYNPIVDNDLRDRIAKLLNLPKSEVRRQYPRTA